MSKWTRFMDMHSGGRTKIKNYNKIYIEAPEKEALVIFYNRFRRNPFNVTCDCCGGDYSISEADTLRLATAYERNCTTAYFTGKGKEIPGSEDWEWKKVEAAKKQDPSIKGKYVERATTKYGDGIVHIPFVEYLKENGKTMLVVYAKDIKAEERKGEVPEYDDY
jgi:hypothetical protein